MAAPNLAVFKYKHRDPVMPAWAAIGLWLGIAAIVGFLFRATGEFAFFALIAFVIVVIARWPQRRLVLAPRYFVCGNTLVYYANVRRIVLRPGDSMSIAWGDNRHFKLERDRFPTGARKTHKIAANKLAKFNKVSGKIIDRVKVFAPGVELVTGKRGGE